MAVAVAGIGRHRQACCLNLGSVLPRGYCLTGGGDTVQKAQLLPLLVTVPRRLSSTAASLAAHATAAHLAMRLIAACACALSLAARAHAKVAEFGGCYSSTTHSTTCAFNQTACGSDTWLNPRSVVGEHTAATSCRS